MSNEPHIVFNEVNQRQGMFHRRALLFGGFAALGALGLSARLLKLQLLDNGRYSQLSASNQFNYRLVPPPRGRILDRNGVELASNRPTYRLLVSRDEVGGDVEPTLEAVSAIITIPDPRRKALAREFNAAGRYIPVAIADDLTWDQFARVNARLPELPGVTPDMGELRVYPYGGAFAHVIGYVAKASDADLSKARPDEDQRLLHDPGFRIGKQGVEKALDLKLRGKAGGRRLEVDARGRVVRKDAAGDQPAVPGQDVVLTLDADIQNRALEVFKEESGAAVLMDCRSGDILCMASMPSFDPNSFVKGVGGAEYAALMAYDHKPLLNKALGATYPPGSTFKTMVALAALESGYDPATVHVCNKSWAWGGRVWHCGDGPHGALAMRDAIATSCDIWFYQCALAIGPDRIAKVAREFGLGQVFDIDMPGQKKGLVPDTAYKRRRFRRDPVWHPGETPSMGIGQGYLNLNPLQLCVQAARLANGRKAIQPRLVHAIGGVVQPGNQHAPDLPFRPEHIRFVTDAMGAVTGASGVHIAHATGAHIGDLGLGDIKVAGKTGTAQPHTYAAGGHGVKGTAGEWKLRDHAWFICFAPFDEPRYAMSVLVEHGGWGSGAAAPKALEIMRVALLKDPAIRARIEKPMPIPVMADAGMAVGAAPPPPTDQYGNPVAQPLPDDREAL